MKLKPFIFAFSCALPVSLAYIANSLFTKYYTRAAVQLNAGFLHIPNMRGLAPYIKVTTPDTITGALQIFVAVYACTLLTALLYNFLGHSKRS